MQPFRGMGELAITVTSLNGGFPLIVLGGFAHKLNFQAAVRGLNNSILKGERSLTIVERNVWGAIIKDSAVGIITFGIEAGKAQPHRGVFNDRRRPGV